MRRQNRRVVGLGMLVLLGAAHPAKRPPPELRLELGMHSAIIRSIAVDDAGRTLVTGSEDKTVRVWDTEDGRLLQVLRLPGGAGNDGKVYAVALSPDSELVAAGGWMGTEEEQDSIYLFERASGKLRRLPGLPGVVKHLAFSRDGRRLAAVLGESGLRVFNVVDGALLGQDTAYGAASYGADFDAKGRLVTSCYDGTLRLYDAALHPLAQVVTRAGKRPEGVRFAPDGGLIAVGFHDSTAVEVWSGRDLSHRQQPDTTGVEDGNLCKVVWLRDRGGTRLCAGGRWQDGGKNSVRCWLRGGQGPPRDTPVADSTIMDLVALPDGRVAFAAGEPTWGVLDPGRPASRPAPQQRAPLADLRSVTLRLDEKGQTLAFAYEYKGQAPATFSLLGRRLALGPPAASLTPPRTEAPDLTITDWHHTTEVLLNGRPLPLQRYERSRSLALGEDGRALLLGSDWSLRLLEAQGALRWETPAPGAVWGVHLAARGRLAVAAFGDGTLRWFSARNGRELLAFFPHADRKRWLLWTPAGYYDASPGAEDLIGWVIDRGRDQAPDYFPASRFQRRLYRPDVISRALDRDAPEPPPDGPLALPPVVRILAPPSPSNISTSDATVRVDLRPPPDEPLRKVQLLLGRQPYLTLEGNAIAPGAYSYQLPLPPGESTLAVLAWTASSEASEPAVVTLRRPLPTPASTPAPVARPALRLLAVGARSPRVQPALTYPGEDAHAVARALQRQQGQLYGALHPTVLADGDATRARIIDGLEALAHSSGPRDTTLVFLAGHGLMDGRGRYHFVPQDGDPAHVGATLISDTQLVDHLRAIPGRVIVMLDTCHAAVALPGTPRGPALDRLINELSRPENGIVVYSAAQGSQQAYEKPEWGHGAFTLALLEALGAETKGPPRGSDTTAALQHMRAQGKLTLARLNDYLSDRVRELTRGAQQPAFSSPATPLAGDTPLAYLPQE